MWTHDLSDRFNNDEIAELNLVSFAGATTNVRAVRPVLVLVLLPHTQCTYC